MIRAMLDIETLDVTASSVVTEIGVVLYNGKFDIVQTLHMYTPITEQLARGRTLSKETLKFRFEQASFNFVLTDPNDLYRCLYSLIDLYKDYSIDETWTKSPHFDIAILDHLYQQMNLKSPWKYSSIRDLRTLMKWYEHNSTKDPEHTALQDALDQGEILRDLYYASGRHIHS